MSQATLALDSKSVARLPAALGTRDVRDTSSFRDRRENSESSKARTSDGTKFAHILVLDEFMALLDWDACAQNAGATTVGEIKALIDPPMDALIQSGDLKERAVRMLLVKEDLNDDLIDELLQSDILVCVKPDGYDQQDEKGKRALLEDILIDDTDFLPSPETAALMAEERPRDPNIYMMPPEPLSDEEYRALVKRINQEV